MGIYLNPGNRGFQMAVNSEIFVDKSEMISYLNSVVNTNQRYLSVTRPRRFGKTMAVNMICAYYDREASSRRLFEECKLSHIPGWDKYLASLDVIRVVMTDFIKKGSTIDMALDRLQRLVIRDLVKAYPAVDYKDKDDLFQSLQDVYSEHNLQFVILIDEWDICFREYKEDQEEQKKYLDFLSDLLKDKEYVALAYIIGILPIKKYGKHCALNMFSEYSMTQPMHLASFTGFTVEEVQRLCNTYEMDYGQISDWYEGYIVSDDIPISKRREYWQGPYEEHRLSVYSPLSVVNAMRSGVIDNYWNETESYEALREFIDWDFDGLKENVAILMEGGRVPVDIAGYQNDLTSFQSKDDILTMLIHLGYLGYERKTREVFIPNKEVLEVFRSSTKGRDWTETFRALNNSQRLLEAT